MKRPYLIVLALAWLSSFSLPVQAQSEDESQKGDTRIDITITKDGETRSLEIQSDETGNLSELLQQVEELEGIEINDIDGDIEVIVRSANEPVFNFNSRNFLRDKQHFFESIENGEPKAFLGIVGNYRENGIHLDEIIEGSGAEKAGLQTGDVIVEVGGKNVESYKDLTDAIGAQKPGDALQIKIDRDGKKMDKTATLGERKMNHSIRFYSSEDGEDSPFAVRKLEKNFSTNFNKGYLGVEFSMKEEDGVLLKKVIENSPAAEAGLMAGDRITALNGIPVANGQEFMEAMKDTEAGDEVKVDLEREGQKVQKKVKLDSWKDRIFKMGDGKLNKGFRFHSDDDVKIKVLIKKSTISEKEEDLVNKALGMSNKTGFNSIDLELYPNPGKGRYTVNVQIPGIEKLDMLVLDQAGRTVFEDQLQDGAGNFKKVIDLTGEAVGTYFLVLKNENQVKIEKLIKE